jgi:hypothetical protein
MINELSRRHFNALLLWNTLAFLVPRPLIDFSRIPNTPTELAIWRFLNLTPEQCQLSINVGDHAILDQSMKVIAMEGPVILTGEQRPSVLTEFLTIDPQNYLDDSDTRNVCVNPGVGSAPVNRFVNATNLQQLVQTGVTIVTTDAEDSVLGDLQHLPKNTILQRIGLGVGLVALLALVKRNLSNNKEKMSMKTALKYAPVFIFAGGIGLVVGILGEQMINCGQSGETKATETLGRVPVIEQQLLEEVNFEQFIDGIKGRPQVMDYYEGLVNVRNLEMAYHLWRVVAESVGKDQMGVKIFAKHGNVHGAVGDLFMRGPDALQKELTKYIKKVVQVGNTFHQIIIDTITQKYISDKELAFIEFQEIQDTWFKYVFSIADYIRFFQETSKVGDNPVLSLREIESVRRPPSARTLMFREVIDAINLADEDKGVLSSKKDMFKSALMVALAKDAQLEIELIKAKSNLKGELRLETVMKPINLQQTRILWFDQFMKGSFEKEFYTIEDQLIVGCVEINGRICPVVREFTVIQDQIIGVDKVLLNNDQVAIGRTYRYLTNKPDGLPKDYLGTVDIAINAQKTKTKQVSFVQAQDFAEPNVYWLQDQIDLAKIDIIKLQ